MIKPTIPFNYDDLYSSVQQKFVDKGYDIQEGSNTMQIASVMAYLVSMLNTNTAININETLLTLARKRNTVLHDSRILGYEPGNKVSYQYYITLKFTPLKDENQNYVPTSFDVPKYSKFTANSKNYYYYGDLIRIKDIIEPLEMTIIVKEGNLLKSETTSDLKVTIGSISENGTSKTQYYVDVPYSDVEDDGIDCFLTYYDDNANLVSKELWTKFDRFQIDIDTILNKQFYRLNVIEYNFPRIYLKLPNTGKDLRVGTVVEMNILVTSGIDGEMTELPKTDEIICEIIDYKLKLQGTNEETIESIKYNAPLFYNSANRAVTKNDFISICNRLTSIDKTYVWDGNDEYPQKQGMIWFSFIPQTRDRVFESDMFRSVYRLENPYDKVNWFLEDLEITDSNESIFNKLESYKIPTMTLVHRHPIYMDFYFTIEIIKYDITTSESKQNAAIFKIIDEYFFKADTYNTLENFETEFFLSNLIKKIDTQLADITGVNIAVRNDIKLSSKYISNEFFGDDIVRTKKVLIPLGFPYVNIYSSYGKILSSKLPKIDTDNFLSNYSIKVDYDQIPDNSINSDVVQLDINLYLRDYDINDVLIETKVGKIGSYRIFHENNIVVELIISDIFTEEMCDNAKINITYPNNNIKFSKNCLPRLNTVDFL
jgi:hypothetical protein